ncbi:type I-F CRISPR-associated protein Csy1 [Serratia sp. S1B]|nr:type I-F CRISPR-associated protein Csy1 [Serratia sp. S1B]
MSETSLSLAIDAYISSRQEAKPDKWPTKADWLDDASKRAKQITLVTHAPKFTHGDARGVGARVEANGEGNMYLSTANLAESAIDVIGNAAALDVANLLLLEAGGHRLVDRIKEGDPSALSPFTKSKEQLGEWCGGLSLALECGVATSHTLAKQTYFPLPEGAYHLLSPLFASSLCHALHQRIDHARFSDQAKEAREARRKELFSESPIVDFPHLAEQHFGGTKPQNVSLLNSKRYGRTYLLNCQPPSWQSRLAAPESEAHFWQQYSYQVRAITRELTGFLKLVEDKDNNHTIKQRRAELVNELVDMLHNYAAQLRTLPAGWSQKMTEPMQQAFCYWLDRGITQKPADWEKRVGLEFGRWLNRQLQKQLGHIGDAELLVWRRQLARELRLLKQDLEEWA